MNQEANTSEILELIDTLWNVNVRTYFLKKSVLAELIDTLWNVNFDIFRSIPCSKQELIDTLWNVNEGGIPLQCGVIGINRYIMECKYAKLAWLKLHEPGINRYIMECKYRESYQEDNQPKELIDTLWNVNEEIKEMRKTFPMELIDTLWNVNQITDQDNSLEAVN